MAKSLRPQAPGSFNRVSPGQQDIQVQSSPVDTSVEYGAEGMPAPPVQETPLAPFDPSAGQNELAWANALASGAQMFGQIREMDMQAEQLEQQELATLAQVAQSELIALNMTFSEALEAKEIQAIEHPGIQAGRTRADAVLLAERFSDQIETEYPSIQDSEALQTLDGANAFFKTQFDQFIEENRPTDGQDAVFEEAIGLARRSVLKNLLSKHAVYLGKVNHQKSIEAVGGDVRSHVRAAFNEITNNPDATLESVLDSDMGVALFQNMLDDETRHADGTANTMTRAAYRQHVATALLDIAADRPDQTELAMGLFKRLEYGTRQTKKNGEPAKRSSLLEDSVISEHYNKRFKEIQSNVSRVRGSSASSSDVRKLAQEEIHSQVPRQFIGRKESLMGPPEDGESSIRTVFANTSSGRRDFAADTGSDGLVSRIISNPEFTETWGEGWEVIPSLSTDDKVVVRNVTTGDPSDEITFDVADLVERGEKARFDHFKLSLIHI